MRYGDTIVVIDAGSGIREMSRSWAAEFAGQPISANLLFTHAHWDHIQGFPFFSPAYKAGNCLSIYGEERPAGPIEVWLSGQMQDTYFPIPMSAMKADCRFISTTPQFDLGPVRVSTQSLPHPGGCLGYRLEVDDHVLVMATDCELNQVAANRDALAVDPGALRGYDDQLLAFLSGANVLIVDCQFTDEQYAQRVGWGHNSLSTVVDLCEQVRPDVVALFHHDPQSDDHFVAAMVADAYRRLQERKVAETLVLAAREGLKMRVAKPKPPLSLRA